MKFTTTYLIVLPTLAVAHLRSDNNHRGLLLSETCLSEMSVINLEVSEAFKEMGRCGYAQLPVVSEGCSSFSCNETKVAIDFSVNNCSVGYVSACESADGELVREDNSFFLCVDSLNELPQERSIFITKSETCVGKSCTKADIVELKEIKKAANNYWDPITAIGAYTDVFCDHTEAVEVDTKCYHNWVGYAWSIECGYEWIVILVITAVSIIVLVVVVLMLGMLMPGGSTVVVLPQQTIAHEVRPLPVVVKKKNDNKASKKAAKNAKAIKELQKNLAKEKKKNKTAKNAEAIEELQKELAKKKKTQKKSVDDDSSSSSLSSSSSTSIVSRKKKKNKNKSSKSFKKKKSKKKIVDDDSSSSSSSSSSLSSSSSSSSLSSSSSSDSD